MLGLQIKLSRGESILAALAIAILAVAGVLYFLLYQEAEAQDRLTASVRRAELVLEQTRQEADLAPLQAKEQQLKEAIAKIPPLQTGKGDVQLSLRRWADDSNAKIQAYVYTKDVGKIADTSVVTNKYTIALRGDAKALHSFVASLTSSVYNPVLESVSLKHPQGQAMWEMNLIILVYSQEA